MWRWEGDQFGDILPTGNLTFLIRHAGQYYDAEVNIFYNYFRDYDPITGRYVESDPIGLDGGLNTYGYANANSLMFNDPLGLFVDENGAFTKATNAAIKQGVRIGAICSSTVAVGIGLLGVSTNAGSCEAAPIECPHDNDCLTIYADINKVISELERRFRDLKDDPLDLYNRRRTGIFSYEGHRSWYNADRERLISLVSLAKSKGCLNYNPEADYWMTKNLKWPHKFRPQR